MAEIGHNSGTGVGIARDHLKSIVERIERLEEEKQAIADDIKEVYAEAKGNGFDTKIIRQVIRIRKQDTAERQEQEALLDVYLAALGMAISGDDAEAEAPPPRRGAKSAVAEAVAAMGTPVELTEEERAKGYSAAFVGKDGTRMAIGANIRGSGGGEG